MKSVHLFFIRTPFRLQDTIAHPEDEILEIVEYDNGDYSWDRIEYKDLEETFQSRVKCADTLFVLGTGNVPFRVLTYLTSVLSDEECTISKIEFKTTLTKDDIDDLCEGLSKNTTAKELVIRDLRDEFVHPILSSIRGVEKLTIHGSIWSRIHGIFDPLRTNTTLRELRFICNTISTRGMKELIKNVLPANTTLQLIDLGWSAKTSIDDELYQDIINLLKCNPSITSFEIGPFGLHDRRSPNIVETMTPLLQDNHTLTHLIIGDEDETPEFIQRNIRIKESRVSHSLSLFEKMLPTIEDESSPKRCRK